MTSQKPDARYTSPKKSQQMHRRSLATMKSSDEITVHPDEDNLNTLEKGNIMELSSSFLFEHSLEIRLIVAALSVVGGYGLVKLLTLLGEARDAGLEAYRKASEGRLSTSAAGAH